MSYRTCELCITRVCRLDIAVERFLCTEIYPINRNVFIDLDFTASFLNNSAQSRETIAFLIDVPAENSVAESSSELEPEKTDENS